MSEYKLCKSLGLKVHGEPLGYVMASDLEALLSKGVEVFGVRDAPNTIWGKRKEPHRDCYSGMIINIKPISRPVSKKELLDMFNKMCVPNWQVQKECEDIISRIESQGIEG